MTLTYGYKPINKRYELISEISLDQLSKEIHIWLLELNKIEYNLSDLKILLNNNELKRLNQYAFFRDKHRFLVSRSILKIILSNYLDTKIKEITINYNPYGKPCLDKSINPNKIDFSLAHSHELVVYAITIQRRVGVDIEYIHRKIDYERIAFRFFTERENEILRSLPETKKREVFYDCWTHKEALLKALGDEMILDFKKIEVALAPGEEPRIIRSNYKTIDASEWQIEPFSIKTDYLGSIVGDYKPWKVNYLTITNKLS